MRPPPPLYLKTYFRNSHSNPNW